MGLLVLVAVVPAKLGLAIENQEAEAFVGQDLHLQGRELMSYQIKTGWVEAKDSGKHLLKGTGKHILVFREGFSMSVEANEFSSDKAVVWLESTEIQSGGKAVYKTMVYLQGNVSIERAKAAQIVDLSETVIEKGEAMLVRFDVSGEIFVTADKREIADPRGLPLYAEAFDAVAGVEPDFTGHKVPGYLLPVRPVPELPAEKVQPEKASEEVVITKPPEKVSKPEEKKPQFRYPINLSPVGEVMPDIEWDEKAKIGTWIGRLYLWQKQDERGGLLEFQADNAVIFLSPVARGSSLEKELSPGTKENVEKKSKLNSVASGVKESERDSYEDILASAIYVCGDVVMTEGQRTIRADEMYYDFEGKRGIAINAVMRNFAVSEGIPVYVRAAKLKRLAENEFAADNATLTTSEFYLPQLSVNASKIIITDTTTIDEQEGRVSKSSYDAQMYDVSFKMYDTTIFSWPYVRSNLERPDIPIRSAHTGYDSDWGALLETRWYLARLLGLQEPEGTDSTFELDYYSKRGIGGGVEIDYEREEYFGRLLGYVIHDSGEDRLGRAANRRNLKPPRELRGRFSWRHRHFLPYDWQLTTGIDYESDKHFVESYYRNEFMVGLERETYIHLKRIEDNWGLSFLGKVRINDFVNKLEELPTAEFHWTGQSFLDDKLTFYSDTQFSQFRQRFASDRTPTGPEDFFTFMATRNEVDMPMTIGKVKVVPFVAGTVAYEDGLGFYTELDGGTTSKEDNVSFGEGGVRITTQPYWKVFPDVKSRLWDLNQLRHIISPYMTLVGYMESDSVIEQRDSATVGISQRLQTKRGSGEKQRTVDWMRLDMDVTLVSDSADVSEGGPGPDRFIWNKPFIPLVNRISRRVPQQDRRSSDIFGPRRNYLGADYIWRLSDTTAILSDMNYDMQSGVVQQLNVGFSHMRWPNLSYYIGSRYLKRLKVLDEVGSNAFIFALTYVLDPRYTVVFSQQYDFDYGANIRRDITLIRRYHRVYCGLTFRTDESLDKQSIVFSIWPQGVPELAIGQRQYMGLSSGYD